MAAMLAKYWMTLLVLTVFPAPDSPLEAANESEKWVLGAGPRWEGGGACSRWPMDLRSQVQVGRSGLAVPVGAAPGGGKMGGVCPK